jgi:anti-sigma factor RsiW
VTIQRVDRPEDGDCFRRLGSFRDGEAEAADLAQAEAHIAQCPACTVERNFELRLLAAIRGQVRTPAGLRLRILAAMRREHGICHLQ